MSDLPDFVEKVLVQQLPCEKQLALLCLADETFKAGMTPDYEQLCQYTKYYVTEVLLVRDKEQASELGKLCIEEAASSFYYGAVALICGERVYGLPWAISVTFLNNLSHALSKFGYRFAAPMVLDAEGNVTVIMKKEGIQAEEGHDEEEEHFEQFATIIDGGRGHEQAIEQIMASLSRRSHARQNRRQHDD